MNSKRSTSGSNTKLGWSARLLRAGLVSLVGILGGGGLAVGCLDRPVTPLAPKTSNQFVTQIRQTSIDKVDLLFMIDNSSSMADKQAILAKAVPQLVQRLITPLCVNAAGEVRGNSTAAGVCPANYSPEFNPLPDIHIGIVSSSLGGRGGNATCTPDDPANDDHAHLLATVRPGLDQWNGKGFLVWDPLAAPATNKPRHRPPGEFDPAKFINSFTAHVTAADENGCGFESQLEAWYRFLVQPDPLETVKVVGGALSGGGAQLGHVEQTGTDKTVLDQRAAFLRPDSLVAIIMLTDENDCSIRDDGLGWMVSSDCVVGPDTKCLVDSAGNANGLSLGSGRGTSQCLTNPNDPCCEWCIAGKGPTCPDHAGDSECAKGPLINEGKDSLNLRCFKHRKRFGIDLLYPVSRYVDGIVNSQVPDRTGKMVQNPLFAPTADKPSRPKELVFVAGLVGVPWQDISTSESLPPNAVLRYMTAKEMREATPNRWDVVLGEPSASPPKEPLDPLMLEQPEPRSGLSPIINQQLADVNSTNPRANSANGHEWKANEPYDDLQYSCIFKLSTPRNCANPGGACDCGTNGLARNKPLCNPLAGGAATTTQNFAKAYPGTRILEVLKGVRDQAIVASICPKFPDEAPNDPQNGLKFGYNPAVNAIVDRLKEQLKSKCLPRELKTEADGRVPCAVVEVAKKDSCTCDQGLGRRETSNEIRSAVRGNLETSGVCGNGPGLSPCDQYCTCEINQYADNDLERCVQGENPDVPGYCYIDDNTPNVKPEILKECADTERHKLRFAFRTADGEIPARGAITYIACLGGAVSVTDNVDAGLTSK